MGEHKSEGIKIKTFEMNTSSITQEGVEHLLRPRYKVIDKWPNMKDFFINQVVLLDKKFSPQYQMVVIEDCQGLRQYTSKFFDEYPHLFKKLHWATGRKKRDLPKYIRFDRPTKVGYVIKEVFGYEDRRNGVFVKIKDDHWDAKVNQQLGFDSDRPATEQEYKDFIKSKEQTNG